MRRAVRDAGLLILSLSLSLSLVTVPGTVHAAEIEMAPFAAVAPQSPDPALGPQPTTPSDPDPVIPPPATPAPEPPVPSVDPVPVPEPEPEVPAAPAPEPPVEDAPDGGDDEDTAETAPVPRATATQTPTPTPSPTPTITPVPAVLIPPVEYPPLSGPVADNGPLIAGGVAAAGLLVAAALALWLNRRRSAKLAKDAVSRVAAETASHHHGGADVSTLLDLSSVMTPRTPSTAALALEGAMPIDPGWRPSAGRFALMLAPRHEQQADTSIGFDLTTGLPARETLSGADRTLAQTVLDLGERLVEEKSGQPIDLSLPPELQRANDTERAHIVSGRRSLRVANPGT